MSKQEIQQNNSMIALFMGAILDYYSPQDRGAVKCIDDIWYDAWGDIVEGMSWWNFEQVEDKYLPQLEDRSDYWCAENELQYHSSWDWLIPCVQKINEMDDYEIIICGVIKVYCTKHNQSQIQSTELFTLEGVYQAVCETIKLINNE